MQLARGHNHKALADELGKEKEKKRLKKEKKRLKKEKKKAKKKEKKAKKEVWPRPRHSSFFPRRHADDVVCGARHFEGHTNGSHTLTKTPKQPWYAG